MDKITKILLAILVALGCVCLTSAREPKQQVHETHHKLSKSKKIKRNDGSPNNWYPGFRDVRKTGRQDFYVHYYNGFDKEPLFLYPYSE